MFPIKQFTCIWVNIKANQKFQKCKIAYFQNNNKDNNKNNNNRIRFCRNCILCLNSVPIFFFIFHFYCLISCRNKEYYCQIYNKNKTS